MWLKPSLLWLGLALGLGGMLWSDLDVVLVHSPIEAFRWDRRQSPHCLVPAAYRD